MGADLRRAFRLGVRSPDAGSLLSVKEVRFIAGVKPVEQAPASFSRGPGSEKRTRFLDFFGVVALEAVCGATGSDAVPCLVRCETGDSFLECETELLLRFLQDCLVSMFR